MRLIDADKMLVNLTEAFIAAQLKCDALTAKVNIVVHAKMTRLINDTPTAYDLDKVIEELAIEFFPHYCHITMTEEQFKHELSMIVKGCKE